jgi:hypothetical protein
MVVLYGASHSTVLRSQPNRSGGTVSPSGRFSRLEKSAPYVDGSITGRRMPERTPEFETGGTVFSRGLKVVSALALGL